MIIKKTALNKVLIIVPDLFNDHRGKYIETYKSVELLELNPKKLTDNDEYNNLFFEKIDEIDDLVFQGNNLDHIVKKYNYYIFIKCTG